jgi:hypothetical protein
MSFHHALIDVCLWTLSSLYVATVVARMGKSRKVNRRLPAPSSLCERTGDFETRMHGTVFARRQGN